MKHSTFRVTPGSGGFIRTTLVPVGERGDTRFGWFDVTMLFVLIFGALFIARTLVGQ